MSELIFGRSRRKQGNIKQESTITIPFAEKRQSLKLIQSNRKSFSLEVKEDGSLLVRAPLYFSEDFLVRWLLEKEEWILDKQSLQQKKLELKQQQEQEYHSSGAELHQKEALEKRYRKAAKIYIPQRVEYYARHVGVTYEAVRIREQKTRWGSCSSNKTLSFNWRLMLAPPQILDYVIVHEVCHLRHMNHSKEFWSLVETIMPDYKDKKKWLKENGHRLYEG